MATSVIAHWILFPVKGIDLLNAKHFKQATVSVTLPRPREGSPTPQAWSLGHENCAGLNSWHKCLAHCRSSNVTLLLPSLFYIFSVRYEEMFTKRKHTEHIPIILPNNRLCQAVWCD